ncbi:MAG TPA: LUD domain-containing protein [Terracidiphilus sp.]
MSAAGSRAAVLDRIRSATPDASTHAHEEYERIARGYRMSGNLTPRQCVELMIERLREYDAEVVECGPCELQAAIAAQIEKSGCRMLAAPRGLPREWMDAKFDWRVDHGLAHEEIEKAHGVVTAATCGVAESGTIVLHHTPAEGRRVLTLLPDWHLCVLRQSQVVETLPEYFKVCGGPAPALATFISGPSATADIEMTRIKGVHGPRFLNVIVVRDQLG